jgi:uroporphyrinogen decarboxylase
MNMESTKITHRDRMQAFLSGQSPDRLPIALWRHFPVDDQDPYRLAAASINFQNSFDFDLVKVTPASSFCLKDWGAEDRWEGNPEGTRRYTKHVIQSPKDWEDLTLLDPTSRFLAKQLECLSILRKKIDSNTPIIQTIFNPLSQAKNLASGETLLTHIRLFPEAVLKGLETIAKSTRLFIDAAIDTGIDGIFFAVQHAQAGLLTISEYEQFGKKLDVELLDAAQPLWCNILHLHGTNIYFDMVTDYPTNIINWHDQDTSPSLHEAFLKYNGFLCGGLKRETISLGSPLEIKQEISDSISQVSGKRLLLGTGCVVPSIAPYGNIMAARRMVDEDES